MKKIAIVFLSLFLVVSLPLSANANIVTATGKYIINVVKHLPGHTRVEATNTVTGAKHAIKHGVSSQALSQGIAAGIIQFGVAGGLGLAFEAITGLALNAVDWVLDPANNSVKYKQVAEHGTFLPSVDARCNQEAAEKYGKDHAMVGNMKARVEFYRGNFYGINCVWNGNSMFTIKDPALAQVSEQSVSLTAIAAKTLELANNGNSLAQKDIEDYVTAIAKRGDLDTALDNATEVTKPDDPTEPEKPKKECPVGTIRVGDICIPLPDDLPPNGEQGQCGICCAQLIAILAEMAKMNEQFYEKSLDNDAQALIALNQINAQLNQLTLDFNALLAEAKLTNQALTEINNNQELHFNELKQKADELKLAIETGDASILAALADVQSAIDLTNLKLDKLNLNLEKVLENLEKMQKCEGTELNQKLCEFMDWFKSEPTPTDVTPVDVKEIEAKNSNKINMSGECPAPYELNFVIFGYSQNNSISYAPLCSALTMLKPIFVGAGALSSMFILMGYNRPNGGN